MEIINTNESEDKSKVVPRIQIDELEGAREVGRSKDKESTGNDNEMGGDVLFRKRRSRNKRTPEYVGGSCSTLRFVGGGDQDELDVGE